MNELRVERSARNVQGSTKDMAEAIGKDPAQISQWFSGFRNIGDAAARQIEDRLGLHRGYLDGIAGPSSAEILSAALLSAPDLTNQDLVGLIDALTKSFAQDSTINNRFTFIAQVLYHSCIGSDIPFLAANNTIRAATYCNRICRFELYR